MNAITQENNQAMLHDHYNQANQAFQEGDFARALKELEQALQYAENDKQAAHIQQSIRTVSEMMQQEPTSGPTQAPQAQPEVAVTEEQAQSPTSSNKLVLLTVLVGLICLMPIVMKCIEIFTQPSTRTEQAQTTTNTTPAAPGSETTTSNTTDASNTAPASPVATPAVIVDATEAAKWTVIGSGINMRAEASTKAASLGKLSAGESVKMLESQAQSADNYVWSKIETSSGTQGWVASQFLKQEETAPAAVPPATTTTTTTTTTSVQDPATAPATTDATGTTPTEVASPAAATGVTRSIAGSGVSLRASAGTQGALITVLSPSQITVLPDAPVQANGFNWVKIRTSQGTEGWIADKFLGN